ncbi:helix-turn-helix domain-containing protein [Helicobacter sp. faydin-H20]|uniref:XRE family transcriptional regulator n=1 Tax=Helicobacter anatolicus TaxID=2905874 RepID=UPI001E34BC63|nr:LexA family transcriptional regulator [Helicobacter anatolicus]MCE3037482.1 helix-turn-helix domain-containing protein [Helicobacter anatolicus]
MNISQKIKIGREHKNMTQADLAKTSGVPIDSIKRYERVDSNITITNLVKIAQALEVDLNFFYEEYHTPTTIPAQSMPHLPHSPTPQHTIKYYPNIRVSAGYGIANFEEEFELIDATFLNTFNLANVKNLEMVQVQGDSMLPYIEDGEFIILERKSDFKNGEIIVFNLNDNIYIKQALRIPNQNKISCISKNPLFPSFDIEGDDLNKMQLIGILRAKIKRF